MFTNAAFATIWVVGAENEKGLSPLATFVTKMTKTQEHAENLVTQKFPNFL